MSAPTQEAPLTSTKQTNRSLEEDFQPAPKKINRETDVVSDENSFIDHKRLNFDSIGAKMIIIKEENEENFANKKIVQMEMKIPDTFIQVEQSDNVEKYIDHLKSASGAEVQIQSVENSLVVSDKMKHILHGYRQIEEKLHGTIKKKLIQITLEIPIQDESGISTDVKFEDLESFIQTSEAFIEINKTSKTLIFKIMGHEEQIRAAKLAIGEIFQTSINLHSTTYLGERYYTQTNKISNSVEVNLTSDECHSWLMDIEQ